MIRRGLSCVLGLLVLAGGAGAEELRLPEGHPVRGRKVFIENYCGMCHHVAGQDIPRPLKTPWADIRLGGPGPAPSTIRLVNDIIDPQHRIDTKKWPDPQGHRISPMLDFSVNLSVRDLADLVQFLKLTYGVQPRD